MEDFFQLVECPRDAMQGWKKMIPPEMKIRYINSLVRVGFHTLDMGSFVSPKIIPQMADTAEVISGIDMKNTATRLLARYITWVFLFLFHPHFNKEIPTVAPKNP
jgi:hydroxymethylglutaryl-CoA lyase